MTKMNNKLHTAFELNVEIIMLLDEIAKKVTDADSDAENKSYHFKYNDEDLFNALLVFYHVWMNRAIHTGALTMENVHEKMEAFGRVVHDTYGIDTVELSKKVMEELNGTETEKDSTEK